MNEFLNNQQIKYDDDWVNCFGQQSLQIQNYYHLTNTYFKL